MMKGNEMTDKRMPATPIRISDAIKTLPYVYKTPKGCVVTSAVLMTIGELEEVDAINEEMPDFEFIL